MVGKALYDDKELKGMSEYRKKINNMTNEEWCQEWDRKTEKIRRIHASSYEILKQRREEKHDI